MEIERKYLVKTLPDHLEPVSYTHLDVYKRQLVRFVFDHIYFSFYRKTRDFKSLKNNTKKDLHSISEAQIFLRYHFIIQLQDQASHPPGQILHKFCRY